MTLLSGGVLSPVARYKNACLAHSLPNLVASYLVSEHACHFGISPLGLEGKPQEGSKLDGLYGRRGVYYQAFERTGLLTCCRWKRESQDLACEQD